MNRRYRPTMLSFVILNHFGWKKISKFCCKCYQFPLVVCKLHGRQLHSIVTETITEHVSRVHCYIIFFLIFLFTHIIKEKKTKSIIELNSTLYRSKISCFSPNRLDICRPVIVFANLSLCGWKLHLIKTYSSKTLLEMSF